MLQIIFILFIVIEYVKELITIYNKLFHDGFHIIKNYLHNKDIKVISTYLKNGHINVMKKYLLENEFFLNKIKLTLMNHFNNEQAFNYYVLDYMYILNGSSINNWHRDYTSSKIYNNLEYPSYSMIIYLSNTDLEVIPSSNENDKNIYLCYKSFKNLKFDIGDAIIFDSDLFHKGGNNNKIAIQLKIIHKKDINKLPNLNNYFKENNEKYEYSIFNIYFNECIKYVPFVIDLNHNIIKNCFNGNISMIHKIVTYFLYNNFNYFNK